MKPTNVLKLLFSIFFAIGVVLLAVAIFVYFTVPSRIALLVLGIQSAVWLMIGGIGLAFTLSRARRDRRLLESGTRIEAHVNDIYQDRSISYNGRHPFRIACEYRDDATNTIYVFRSNPLWFDPTPYLTSGKIEVCVDYDNYKKYVVDTGNLAGGARIEVL